MARIKIDIPEKFLFDCTLTVRVTDLNYGNHLGNNALLGLIHESRIAMIRHFGFSSELDFFGTALIMADSAIVYKSEAFLGDELHFSIAATDLSKFGFDLVYRIVNQHQKEVAIAKTGMVCFDYSQRKIQLLPEKMKVAFEG